MQPQPYSIYIDKRPMRIAFLVDPQSDIALFDKIIAYNQERWGGRFNPIILTDGKTIDDLWLKFLEDYDPDIIKSFVALDEQVLKKLHVFLNPFSVEITPEEKDFIRISEYPISILPTAQNVRAVSRDIMDDVSSLAIFEFEETTPEIIKNFLSRNFGKIETGQMMPYHMKKAVSECKIKNYKIVDFESLNSALLDLGEFQNQVVFPIQICAIPNTQKQPRYDHEYEKFGVVVGDSWEELAYFWNRTLFVSSWARTSVTHLWLPNELAENEVIKTGLGKFLHRYTGMIGNNNYHSASFVSYSKTEEDLKKLTLGFQRDFWHGKETKQLTQIQVPNYYQHDSFLSLKSGLELHRANSLEEHIVLDDPEVQQAMMGGENWIADLYIQYRPEKYENFIGRSHWWQLPRRTHVLSNLRMFNRQARINEHRMFSLLMSRKTTLRHDDNTLVVKIPDDQSVFGSLFCGPSFNYYGHDEGEKFRSRPYDTLRRSDKGMYLSGILGLFPDLLNAHHAFEDRFWRKIFDIMSNQDSTKDSQKKSEILNTLNKSLKRPVNFTNSAEYVDWLADKILNWLKGQTKPEVDLAYEEFKEEAIQETDDYNKKENKNQIPFGEDGLKRDISELMEWNVLLAGVKPKCPYCGYRIWYHLDEAKQKIKCKGCGYEFTLSVEETWYYRLNSLVKSGFALHGTVPVLLTLGQLMHDARSSFMFVPSQELFTATDDQKYKLVSEVDIAAIVDGKFIIGEIKQSVSLFDADEFDKIADIAEKVRPDKIIFSSMDRKPNQLVTENIEKLKKRLEPLRIKVEWYQLHYWIFDPSPVR